MDVAVELVVEVVVALVLQRGATRGTLEALHVQVLILDAHENASNEALAFGANVLASWESAGARGLGGVHGGADMASGARLLLLLLLVIVLLVLVVLLLWLLQLLWCIMLVVAIAECWSGLAGLLLAQELQNLGAIALVFLLVLLEVDAEHTASQNLRLGRECFRNRFIAVNANRGVVLFIDNALHAAIAAVGEGTGRVVVATADVLAVLLFVSQRGLRHRLQIRRVGLRHIASRCHMRAPGGATALHCDDKVVAGAHHNVLGILVTQIEDIHVIDLDHRIAGLEASLLGQAAGVHLLHQQGLSEVRAPLKAESPGLGIET